MKLTKLQRQQLKAANDEAKRARQEAKDWYQREKARLAKDI